MSKLNQSIGSSILSKAGQYIKEKTSMNTSTKTIQLTQNVVLLKESVDIMMQTQALLVEQLEQIEASITALRDEMKDRPINLTMIPSAIPAVVQQPIAPVAPTAEAVASKKVVEEDELFIPFPDTSDITVTKRKQTKKKTIKKDFSKKAASLSKEE